MLRQIPFEKQTLAHLIKSKAKEHGNEKFLRFETGEWITYAELDEKTDAIANGLHRLGLKKGSKLAILLPNCLESVFLWFGCAKGGIIDVPINLSNKGFSLSHVINDSEAEVIVIETGLLERLTMIKNDLAKLKKIILWRRNGLDDQGSGTLEVIYHEFSELVAPCQKVTIETKPTDIQTIIYTSGTTGPSKGVMLPNAQQYLEAMEYCEAVKADSSDTFFTCLPLFHANARLMCVLPAMIADAKVVVYERFSASRFWDQINRAKATIFNSLGAMAMFIFKQPIKQSSEENTARVCMAAPMPNEIYHDFEKRFSVKIIEGYGLTETGMVSYNPYDKPRAGSCGKQTESFRIAILDANDHIIPTNSVGEIGIRCLAPYGMTLGYYNLPQKTVEAFRNFFFHTGDAGYLDSDGYLYFVDRIKDYIRRRGENISSFELEKVLNSHEKIAESAAIGIKSPEGEEEVKAFVVLKSGVNMSPEELLDYCVPRMPYFAVPRYVEFTSELPKTPNEKIQKAKLRERGVGPEVWDREQAAYKVNR